MAGLLPVTLYSKGDYVEATQGNKTYRGWVSGDTERAVSVSDHNWKRLGQFSKNKVRLLQRSTGLITLVLTSAKSAGQSLLVGSLCVHVSSVG